MNPVIVQFLHPGKERDKKAFVPVKTPCSLQGEEYHLICPWRPSNDGHARKFIVNSGEYYDGKHSIRDGRLYFWGEAEWDSLCREIGQGQHGIFPCYEHVVGKIPAQYCSAPVKGLNTDPYVFGDAFKYCCCQQRRKTGPTRLHDLPEGSIVLFGSYKINDKVAGFYLDTVFVVDRKLGEYSKGTEMCRQLASMGGDIQRKVSPIYQKRVLETIGVEETSQAEGEECLPTDSAATGSNGGECLAGASEENGGNGAFSLYIGKVFNPKEPNTPFSFVPVIPGNTRYPRPRLSSFSIDGKNVISSNMRQGFKVTEFSRTKMDTVWKCLLKAIPSEYKYAWHIDE